MSRVVTVRLTAYLYQSVSRGLHLSQPVSSETLLQSIEVSTNLKKSLSVSSSHNVSLPGHCQSLKVSTCLYTSQVVTVSL